MPTVNLHQKVRDILSHLAPLPIGADSPIQHFSLTSGDIERTLDYLERKTKLSPSSPAIADRHLGRLRQMALVSLIENLERFLKELAAECIDVIAPLTVDDRLDAFRVDGSAIAGHYRDANARIHDPESAAHTRGGFRRGQRRLRRQ